MSKDLDKEHIENPQPTTPETQTPDTDTAAAEPAAEPTTEELLARAREEIAELNNQLLRKIAEFDNYRRRTIKEKTDLILNGGEKVITAILPVLDDMERAIAGTQQASDIDAIQEGFRLIHKKFTGILEKQGVKAIDTNEAAFDTDMHEAIAQLPAPTDEMKGKVMDCTLTGYTLNDKVIRHAQVVVAI